MEADTTNKVTSRIFPVLKGNVVNIRDVLLHASKLNAPHGENFARYHFALRPNSLSFESFKRTKFSEEYYDTPDFLLIQSNCWLRKRGQVWSLKENVARQADGTLLWTSISGEELVLARLKVLFPKFASIASLIDCVSSVPFSSFITTRLSPPHTKLYWFDISKVHGDKFYLLASIDVPIPTSPRTSQFVDVIRMELEMHPAPSTVVLDLQQMSSPVLTLLEPKPVPITSDDFMANCVFSKNPLGPDNDNSFDSTLPQFPV